MCGNFGFMGQRFETDDQTLLPTRVIEIFKLMGHETEIRGEQAGGGLVVAQNKNNQVHFVGEKVVNRKRHNLTQALEAAFASTRHKATVAGIQPLDAITAVWHYRYGTSSPPKILETHWHEWVPARNAIVWLVENGRWVSNCKTVNHRERLVLSAQGQPMTIGFNVSEAYMIYASEPAAVNAVLAGVPESYRLDLDPAAGEVALVGVDDITVYSLSEERERLDTELGRRSRHKVQGADLLS
jgi:hypothetical protein